MYLFVPMEPLLTFHPYLLSDNRSVSTSIRLLKVKTSPGPYPKYTSVLHLKIFQWNFCTFFFHVNSSNRFTQLYKSRSKICEPFLQGVEQKMMKSAGHTFLKVPAAQFDHIRFCAPKTVVLRSNCAVWPNSFLRICSGVSSSRSLDRNIPLFIWTSAGKRKIFTCTSWCL